MNEECGGPRENVLIHAHTASDLLVSAVAVKLYVRHLTHAVHDNGRIAAANTDTN